MILGEVARLLRLLRTRPRWGHLDRPLSDREARVQLRPRAEHVAATVRRLPVDVELRLLKQREMAPWN